jgi:hypothetical protein
MCSTSSIRVPVTSVTLLTYRKAQKSFHAKSREQNHAEPLAKSWTDVNPKCTSFNAKGIGVGVHEYRIDFGKDGGRLVILGGGGTSPA